MKRIAVVFLLLMLGLSTIPSSLQAYEGQVRFQHKLFFELDADVTLRTVYVGSEGRSPKEMLACALWLEVNWTRWHEGKVDASERCEMYPADSFFILRMTEGRPQAFGERIYIDYIDKSYLESFRQH